MLWGVLCFAFFLASGQSMAEGPELDPDAPAWNAAMAVDDVDGEDDLLSGFAVVDESELSQIRGGEGSLLNIQDLEAVVSDNRVEGTVTTGDSTIGAGAFSNLDGISAVVINTGNNVSIQNSTVVNIVIED